MKSLTKTNRIMAIIIAITVAFIMIPSFVHADEFDDITNEGNKENLKNITSGESGWTISNSSGSGTAKPAQPNKPAQPSKPSPAPTPSKPTTPSPSATPAPSGGSSSNASASTPKTSSTSTEAPTKDSEKKADEKKTDKKAEEKKADEKATKTEKSKDKNKDKKDEKTIFGVPITGDNSQIALFTGIFAVAFVLIGGAIYIKKKNITFEKFKKFFKR